ncbi:MAG: L,D-transpeptidase family protein [Bdellovibrionales bacterium]|nr:L,D-transpeptidase family protein [Bdellovibrionales bacterium]
MRLITKINRKLVILTFLFSFHTIVWSKSVMNEPPKPDPTPITPQSGQVPEALVRLGNGQHFSNYAFLMDKGNRTLTVWKQSPSGLELLSAAPADFGRNSGNKVANGDLKTPEGIYFFQQAKNGAELDFDQYGKYEVKAFTLDYPNYFDALEKKSGSGIWLHSLPDYLSLWRGSKGCVVVRNKVIENISQYIALKKTPILIQNSVQYISKDQASQQENQWQAWMDQWRESWQNKQHNKYLELYSNDFKGLGMNKKKWAAYKKSLAEKYHYIKINLSEPLVLTHQNEVIVRFLQDYHSDQNQDFGEKTLYLRREGQVFKIIGEEWSPLQRPSFASNH